MKPLFSLLLVSCCTLPVSAQQRLSETTPRIESNPVEQPVGANPSAANPSQAEPVKIETAAAEVETKDSPPEPISLSLPADTFWLPISDEEIETQVEENAADGVALSHLWFRVRLANKDATFLRRLREQMDAQPENVTIRAAFIRAVLPFSSRMTYGGAMVPARVAAEFNDVDLRSLIKKGKIKDPKCWLLSVAESEWIPFSGFGALKTIRTDAANAARRAYKLQANPITMKQLAWALVWQGSSERKPEVLPEVQSLLETSQKLYPWSPDANSSLFQMYTYVYKFQDAEKAAEAKAHLISTIPEEWRATRPVVDYPNWIQWDKR